MSISILQEMHNATVKFSNILLAIIPDLQFSWLVIGLTT